MNPLQTTTAPLGLVAAFRWEVLPLLRGQKNIRRRDRGHIQLLLHGRPAVLAIAGAGAENALRATRELLRSVPVAGVISVGFAGGLQEALQTGDLLLAEEVIEEGTGRRFVCQPGLLRIEGGSAGILLSAGAVVNSVEAKRVLGSRWGAVAVDMESAGVAQAAAEWGVPFGALKSITDDSRQSLAIDFQRCRSDDGGLSAWKILRESLVTPHGLRELWRLAGSSRRAAENLALALHSA